MDLLSIVVPGQPIPKGRPRFGKGRAYTPKRTKDYEKLIKSLLPNVTISEPVEVHISAVFKRPQRLQRKNDPAGLIPHDKRPDLDNIIKAVLDALNAILNDDSQVTTIYARKFYAELSQEPRTIITIKKIL